MAVIKIEELSLITSSVAVRPIHYQELRTGSTYLVMILNFLDK